MPGAGKVVVLGSVNVDLLVSTPRLPAAGETVAGNSLTRQLGGKGANQAVAAARAGVRSILFAAVGNDEDGAGMIAALTQHGVDTSEVRITPSATGCAVVATSPHDNQIIHIAGANGEVDASLVARVALAPTDVCLAQMETPAPATAALFLRARSAGACTVLNAAPASTAVLALLPLCDVLIVNEGELALLIDASGMPQMDDIGLLSARTKLGLTPDQVLLLTMGADGVAIALAHAVRRISGRRATVIDTTGAGDCFCGYLAAGLARGERLEQATLYANAAASIAVQSFGAAASIPDRFTMLRSMAEIPG